MKKETKIVYVFLFIGIFNNILFGNLLTNPGFEDTPALTGWIRSGTLSSGVVTSPVVSGNYAARISTSAIAGNKALYQNVNVYEGKRYILSGYTYLIVAQGGESVGLGLKPGGGGVATEWAANVSNSTSTTSQNTWVYLTLSTKVPLGINVIGVNIYLRTSERLSTWATGYFDDISFVFISSPPGQVTGFVATTGSNGGEINLVWVSPTATVGYEDDLPTGCSFYIQYASWTGVNFSTTTQPPEGGYHIWIPTGPVIQGSYCYYTVSGLEEGVTYYFRIWAKDNAGNWSEISDGATAYTQITPLPPRSLTAFSISSSTIKLVWTPSNAVSYRIEHSSVSDSSGWIFRSTVSAAINEYIDENLSSNTTYWYRMFGINSAGGVNWSQPSVIVSTITYPAAPTGFTITTRTATSITWSWTAPVGGCDGYRIYRATDNSLIADQGSATTFKETGLSTNTAYGRFVRAYNIVGESLDSNHATFYTLAVAPVNLQVSEVYSSSITLVWEDGENPSWTRYGVARAEDENFAVNHTTVVTFTDNLTQLTVTVTGLGGSTTYYFRVWAYNGDGVESGYSNIVSTLTHPGKPAAPVGFYAIALSTGSIKWEWNITKNATYYQIYDAYTNTLLANLEGNFTTTWVEVGLSSNTQYSRYVKSGNEYGLSDPSNVVSKYTLAYPPTSLTAIPLSSSTINLTWNYSGATKYQVWYSTDNINYYQTAIVDSTTVNYTYGNLVAGNTYYYKIVPVNGDDVANENFYSLIVPTRTLPSPIYSFSGSALTTTSIKWQWSSALGVDKYRIYSATDNSLIADQVSSTTFIETGLSTNTAYGRYVRAVNTSGLGELSPKTMVYTLAATPTNLYFISVFYTSVTFTWSANGNPYGTKYEVSQSVDNFQTNFSTPISATFDTVVSIRNLSPSTTYYFRVRAFNGDNIPTGFSQIITTTTLSLPQVDICITEVLANDSHSTEGPGEFVEVYNRGSVEVNLAGMFLCGEGDTNDSIVDYTGTYDLGQSGTVLYPGWYALIVDPDYDGWYNTCIQQHADLNKLIMLTISGDTSLGSGGLKNTFGSVWITSGTVVLTSFTWVSDAGNGKSWEKIDYSGPAVDRSDSGNWAVSTHQSDNNSYCTPGFLNSASSGSLLPLSPTQEDVNPSDVVINEFLYDAVSTDNGNEWIELYNNLSTKTVNLAGWKIQKSTGPTIDVAVWTNLFTITSGSVSPNGYFLCAQSTAAVRYRADFQYSDSATMNNSAPFAIRLVTPSGKEIDRVAYGGSGSDGLAEGGKATIAVSAGESLSRYPDGKDTNVNYDDFIKLTNPTPTNSSGPDRIPPAAITDLKAQTGQNPGEIILSWTAPGDDGSLYDNTSDAYYIVKYATYPVTTSTTSWWEQAMEYTQQWNVAPQGVQEQKVLQGFFPGTTYYFAIKTVDDNGNVADIDINAQNSLTQASAYAQVGFIGSVIRINEVAPDQTSSAGYDWIEFFNASTYSVNIFGWKIYEVYTSSTQPIETIEANWSFPAQSYLVLRFGQQRNMSTPQQISTNYYELYTDKPGLTATDNIIVLADNNNNWIDVVCFADRSGSLSNSTRFRAAYNYAVSIGQWYGPYADGTNDWLIEYYCASTLFMSSGKSIARDEVSTDGTNPSVNEWYMTIQLTRGTTNSGMDRTPPAAITTLQVSAGPNRGQVKLSWISVGDDGYTGIASGYMLRYNVVPITEENFFVSINADRISKDRQSDSVYMKPQPSGKQETVVGALQVGVTYYFGIKVLDERINFSLLSNIVSFTPPDIVGSNIRINEFAVLESTATGGDWVELYNASEDTVNIKGWTLWGIKAGETTPSKIKEFPEIFLQPKDYLVVNCIHGVDETISKGDNGYWDVYTTYDLRGFEGVLFLTDTQGFVGNYGNIVDFVAYTSGGAPKWKDIWNTACDYNQWSPKINNDTEGVGYAVDWSLGQAGFSLGRNGFSTDTDNTLPYAKNDWKLYRSPTKGYQNDDVPPATITSFEATSGDVEGSVKLSWVAAGDDGFVGVNYGKYEIKYATFTVETSSTVWWQQISGRNVFSGVIELKIGVDISTVQPANIVSYTITGLFPGLTYYFGIRTYDDVGNVSELDEFLSNNNPVFAVAFDTIPAKVQNVSVNTKSKTVELYWDKNTELDFHHYEIYCDSGTGKIFVSSTTNTYFVHTGLRNGQTYYYELYAVDLKQNMSLPTTVYAIPKIAPPTNVNAKHYGTYVKLVWEHSIDFTTNDFMMYKIYRSTDKNVQFVSVSTTVSNEYQDVSVEKNVYYYYYVVSVDKDGIESEPSNIAEAIPDLLPPKFVSISKLTSRDLAKINAKIDLKVVDDRFVEGDKEGKIISLEGKYRVVGSDREYNVRFNPEFVSGSSEYIGSAEFEFSVITISDKGIEYQFISKDEVNTSYYPSDGGWEKVLPSEDKPEQKFITSSNPEVVFGKEVDEVVIYDQQGNKVWEQKAEPDKLVVWKGQDKNNKPVESGAYIYQIKTKDGKRKYGVVIVVK
jgi:fibronectin type 3 domain-containing protein